MPHVTRAFATGFGFMVLAAFARAEPNHAIPAGAVHVISVQQAITSATSLYIDRAIERALENHAELLVIELDTPGGLLEATRTIVQTLLNTKLPVVVFISPAGARGASAGTMITLAAHVAAMAPATHLGAAHPVGLFGIGGDDKVMAEKVVNDTSAFIKAIAELRGRNAEWAISAVRESQSITSDEAVKLKVVDLIADDLTDLLRQIEGREIKLDREHKVVLHPAGKPVIYQEMSFRQSFMSILSNPNLVYFLLILGLIGLYIEMSNPGLVLPGVLGGISLLVALIAMQTLPISYGAVGLILLGLALLVAEAFVPSFGVLGIGGLASLMIGSLFLMDESLTDLRVSPPMVFGAVATVGVVALWIGRLLLKTFRLRPQSFQSSMVGRRAEVRIAIEPGQPGKVFLNGELWSAAADRSVPAGAEVVIRSVEGLLLRVDLQPANAQDPS
jgi:membrane-bound serine protease (ClpP class)